MQTPNLPAIRRARSRWNKARIVGQEAHLKTPTAGQSAPIELAENHRDQALFNLDIDTSWRWLATLVRMKGCHVMASGRSGHVRLFLQSKTQKLVRFENFRRHAVTLWRNG